MMTMMTGLHNLLQPGSWAARKWRENEKMKGKCRENEEMGRKIFLHISKIAACCRKMLITEFLLQMSQKTYQSAPQVVPAWVMTICMKRKVQEQKPGAALVSATVPRRIGGSLKLIAHVFCVPYASIAFIANHRETQI